MPKQTSDTERRKAQILGWFGKSNIPPIPFAAEDAMFVTGFNEFAYGTSIVYDENGHPYNGIYSWLAKDRRLIYPHPAAASLPLATGSLSDFQQMMATNLAQMPVKRVVLWLNWFTVWHGGGSFIAHRDYCRPAISGDVVDSLVSPTDWQCAGYDASDAALDPNSTQIHRLPGSADTGFPPLAGTPDDTSVIQAMRALKDAGYEVGIACIPRFLNISGGAGEAWEIWRGLISSSAYGYAWANLAQFQAWMNEWRRMFTHYADLAQIAGVTPWIFYTGSEMRETSTNTDRSIREYFLGSMQLAARDVHIHLGSSNTRIDYGADWSEYHARHSDSTPAINPTSFAVDTLFSDHYFSGPALDWYQPIGDENLDSPCDIAMGIWQGENSDYYYDGGEYIATHRLLVDSTDPTDGLGKSGLTKQPVGTPFDVGFASKRLPAYIEGAHYQLAADQPISDPTPPSDWSGTVRAKVSPAPGLYIETGDGIDLGGVTLSDLVGPSDIVIAGSGGEQLMDDVYTLPVGEGVRTPPWQLLKYLPLDGVNDYYAFRLPAYSMQCRVTGLLDPLGPLVRNLDPESDTNKQPSWYTIEEMDENEGAPNWQNEGMSPYTQHYTFEMLVRIDNIPHDENAYRILAFGQATSTPGSQAIFRIALKKDSNNNYHEFEFNVRKERPDHLNSTDGWDGAWEGEFFQDTNKVWPADFGSVYRVQLKVGGSAENQHPNPYAEVRVWNVSKGNALILNQAIGTGANTLWWQSFGTSGTVFIGTGIKVNRDDDFSSFLPGRLYYVGMWETTEEKWGGHFWLDDDYAGTNSIRTGWLPAMRPADITELGYPSMYGMDSEPSTFPTLYTDDGVTHPPLPDTFTDYQYWQTLRERYDVFVYDIGGPYGAGMYADERHQAMALAVAMEQMHNAVVKTQDGRTMKAINAIVVYNFDTRTLDTQLAPNEAGTGLYFGDGPKHRINHALNDKLANQLTTGGGSAGAITGVPGVGQSPGLSNPPAGPPALNTLGSAEVNDEAELLVWFGI